MIDHSLSKVEILIHQKKFAEAEQILKDLLAMDANNIHFLSLLAEVKLQQYKFQDAKAIIENAIGLSPDSPHLYYTRARIGVQQNDYDGAEDDLRQAIELDPADADYFAFRAHIKLSRKKYDEALQLANQALELDAENLLGLNTRSTALLKLNEKAESFFTIEKALREDPNNAYTHANYGWGLLEKGDHKKALQHFKESLKSDPGFEYAQAGMIEALKAANPLYRMFLKYAFWMSNLTARYQWGVIIGFYFVTRALRAIAKADETLQMFLTPVIIILTIFAFSTWIINPVSNLFLRFNTYGKYLLSKEQKMSSNFVAGSFLVLIAGLVLYFVMSDEKFLMIAGFGFAMMVPFGVMFSPSRYGRALVYYAAAMGVIGAVAIEEAFTTGEMFNIMTTIFILGFVAFQWVANYLMIKEDNR